jgi:hypothetical protein
MVGTIFACDHREHPRDAQYESRSDRCPRRAPVRRDRFKEEVGLLYGAMVVMRMLRSTAVAEWVSAPTEMKSTPVFA